MFQTLIDVEALRQHLEDPDWVIVDCRFSLTDTELGRHSYLHSHIPGAVYAHLDEELSRSPAPDDGRHPLPTTEAMVELFGRLGIADGIQVVAYDDANGAYASRLWWMLRYMGHDPVAVLDGGWQAWQEAGLPVRSGWEQNQPHHFSGTPRKEWLVEAEQVPEVPLLVDSRALERFRGETEPLDPVAGHIPGAVNYYYRQNWNPDGRYLAPERMRRQLEALLGDTAPSQVAFYCGSGVTACVNLLAMAHAGLGDGRLYLGSWSEWIRDPERPVATGDS